MSFPSIIAWNCTGVGSNIALRHLLLLLQQHNPNILILVETRVHSNFIDRIRRRTNFSNYIVSEAIGFSRGIWILWDNSKFQLELVFLDEQIINVLVHSTV